MSQSEYSARWSIGASCTVVTMFLVWTNYTSLDLITRGQGRVIPIGQNVVLQTPFAGKVLEFNIAPGDSVRQGQTIAIIDPVAAQGVLAEAEKRSRALAMRLARLDAEMAGREFNAADVKAEDAIEAGLIKAEKALSVARQANLQARIAAFREERSRQLRELEGSSAELLGLQRQISLKTSEASQLLKLVEAGALGISEKFRLEQESNQSQTQLSVLEEKKNALQFAISQTDAEITAAQAEHQNTILEDRVNALTEFAELTQRLPSLRQRVQDSKITVPVDGTVNQVFFNSIGAVVAEGATLAEIVPSNAKLHIEALVLPSEIANIEPGQPVRISLTAFDAAKFGSLSGKVMRVSADASAQGETQERMFVVETSIDSEFDLGDGQSAPIKSGMVAQVDIIRGQRTVLEYFWNPVVKIRDTAFRE